MYDLIGSILSEIPNALILLTNNRNYLHYKGFIGFIEAINYILGRDFLMRNKNGPIISVILDESM